MNQICAKDFKLWNLHSACSKGKEIEECKRCWKGALKWLKPEETIEPWPEPIDEGMPIEQVVDLLNNFTHCLNPPQYVDKKDCPGCQHYQVCAYSGKEQYRKVKP